MNGWMCVWVDGCVSGWMGVWTNRLRDVYAGAQPHFFYMQYLFHIPLGPSLE